MKNNEELLQLAKAFENTTISKKDAVSKFGTEGQKRHFEKYKRFNNKETEKALLKTLNQLFTEVDDKVKIGRGYGYKLGDARVQVLTRIDNRVNNSGTELPYTKYLDAIVLLSLNNNLFKGEYETTLNNWTYLFGLVNRALYILRTAPRSKEALEIRDELRNLDTVTESSLSHEINDFMLDYDSKTRILHNTLTKLAKEKLIKYYEVPKAVIADSDIFLNEEGDLEKVVEYTSVTVKTEVAQAIVEKQAKLREKHKVTRFQIATQIKQSKEVRERVQKYLSDLDSFYGTKKISKALGLKEGQRLGFFYFNRAIYVQATKTRVAEYIKKHRPEFYEDFIENEQELLESIKRDFAEKRRFVVLDKASKKASKQQQKILETFKGFGIKHREELNYKLSIWDVDSEKGYYNNMSVIEKKLKEDFRVCRKNIEYLPEWDGKALDKNSNHLNSH